MQVRVTRLLTDCKCGMRIRSAPYTIFSTLRHSEPTIVIYRTFLNLLILSLSPAAFSQSSAIRCPSTISAGGGPFDLAGAIAKYGSPQALLDFTEQGLRDLSGPYCSVEANAELCRVTASVSRDVRDALKTCILRSDADQKLQPGKHASEGPATGSGSARYDTEDNSDGNQLIRQVAASAVPFLPNNPQQNHTGEPCVFFTQPTVRKDGGGLNAYADDSHVAYGKFYYVCRNRRWMSIGPSAAFANVQEQAADKLERSALSTQVYEKD